MNTNDYHRYSLNFDLHTDKNSKKELESNIGISLAKMYDIIEKHLVSNGFEWVQGSGYISKNKITSNTLSKIVREMYKNNIWLGYFTRDIKRTIVDDMTYSYDSMLKYYSNKYSEKYHNNPFEKENKKANNKNIKSDLKERSAKIVKEMEGEKKNNNRSDIGKENSSKKNDGR